MKGFKLLLAKRYFDTGYGLTSYIKLILLLFGVSSLNVKATIFLGIIYGISCYFIGRFWYISKLVETEHEITNLVNPFMREVRKDIKKRKV